jgi:hypothetical protein
VKFRSRVFVDSGGEVAVVAESIGVNVLLQGSVLMCWKSISVLTTCTYGFPFSFSLMLVSMGTRVGGALSSDIFFRLVST